MPNKPRKPELVTIAALDGLITAYYRPRGNSTYEAQSMQEYANRCANLAAWHAGGVPCFDFRHADLSLASKVMDKLPRTRGGWARFIDVLDFLIPRYQPDN
jgi:hypothetical protein